MSLFDRKNDFYGVNPPTALCWHLTRYIFKRLLGVEPKDQLTARLLREQHEGFTDLEFSGEAGSSPAVVGLV